MITCDFGTYFQMFGDHIPKILLVMVSTLCCYTPADAELCQGPICEYTFVIRHSRTMTYRRDYNVYNVGMEGKDLVLLNSSYHIAPTEGRVVTPADVHTADGVPRNIIVINGEFPGPAIEVMEGTQVQGPFSICVPVSSEPMRKDFTNITSSLVSPVLAKHRKGRRC